MLSLFGVVRVRHLPTFVSVEPANICQLRCPECPVGRGSGKRKGSDATYMSMEIFERVLQQVQATAHTMQFYFQGEPLLHSQLPTMIAKAHRVGLYTIVSTNAQALNSLMAQKLVQSGLNRIIVSIDGFSENSYSAYRIGGSLERALAGLRFLHEAKIRYNSSIRIELQVLRLRTNEHEWGWIRRNYKKLGASHLVFKTAQLYDYKHGNPLMPSDSRYSRYKKTSSGEYIPITQFKIQNSKVLHSHIPCVRLWSGCVITTVGDVLPCCYDKECHHSFGNLVHQSMAEVFHGDIANALRYQVLHPQEESLLKMCRNCDGGL